MTEKEDLETGQIVKLTRLYDTQDFVGFITHLDKEGLYISCKNKIKNIFSIHHFFFYNDVEIEILQEAQT